MSCVKKDARSLRDMSTSSRNRLRVDQIRAHSFNKKFEKIWYVDNCSHLRRRKTIIELNSCLKMTNWYQAEMKNTCQKHFKKKNDHSNVDIFLFHRFHVKRVLYQNTIDLQDNHQIRYNVCVNHLTRVVRTFEQRRKHDDKVRRNATSMFANDLWQFQNNVD